MKNVNLSKYFLQGFIAALASSLAICTLIAELSISNKWPWAIFMGLLVGLTNLFTPLAYMFDTDEEYIDFGDKDE